MADGFALTGFDLAAFVEATLAEDLGGPADASRDITAPACLPADARLKAVLDSRDKVAVAGLPIAAAFFRRLDPGCTIRLLVADGAGVEAGADLMTVEGNARALLAAERSALNTLQHLSGIATLTRRYVDAIAGTSATLLDTRKTIPGLRHLEKYAVRMGGGTNHRMGLHDAPMVKDNHIAAAGGVTQAVATLGTATTPDHAELLFRNSQTVYFCFDGDAAGRKAGWRDTAYRALRTRSYGDPTRNPPSAQEPMVRAGFQQSRQGWAAWKGSSMYTVGSKL